MNTEWPGPENFLFSICIIDQSSQHEPLMLPIVAPAWCAAATSMSKFEQI